MTFFVCFGVLLGFLGSKVSTGLDDFILSSSSEEPEELSNTVEPNKENPNWTTVTKKDSKGRIVEVGHYPSNRVPPENSQGSASNPIPVDDSEDSEGSEGSASNPVVISDSEDSASEKEEGAKKNKKNSSAQATSEDENNKGGGSEPSGPSESPNEPDVGNTESGGNNASKIIGKLSVILGSIIAGLSDFFDNIP